MSQVGQNVTGHGQNVHQHSGWRVGLEHVVAQSHIDIVERAELSHLVRQTLDSTRIGRFVASGATPTTWPVGPLDQVDDHVTHLVEEVVDQAGQVVLCAHHVLVQFLEEAEEEITVLLVVVAVDSAEELVQTVFALTQILTEKRWK